MGRVERGDILTLPMLGANGVPATGVTAVAVNLVSVEADRPSYLQALPTNGAMLGGYSNLNIDAAGQTRANFAIIPVGADGSISVYSIADGNVVIDLLGWFERTDGPVAAGRFVELERAERVLDTRRDAPLRPLRVDEVRTVPMPSGPDPAEVAALVVTVTAAEPTAPGWVQVVPSGRPDVIATTSTVNTGVGGAVANTAIVPVNEGGISVTGYFASNGTSHVIVDVIGYITAPSAPASSTGRFVTVRPGRAYDSRVGTPLADAQSVVVDASFAPGVVVPCLGHRSRRGTRRSSPRRDPDSRGPGRPAPSSLRPRRSTGRSPASSAPERSSPRSTDGRARFRVDDGSADLPSPVGDLIVDVFGYFT